MRLRYDRITTTIEREWLAEIIAGTKKIEYRQIKPYWTRRFEKVSGPFELRLLNGMNPAAVGDGHEAGCASRLRRNHDVEGLEGIHVSHSLGWCCSAWSMATWRSADGMCC
jgi:hypothetical protein